MNLQRRLIALTALLALAGSSLPAASLARTRGAARPADQSAHIGKHRAGAGVGATNNRRFKVRQGGQLASRFKASGAQETAQAAAPRKTLISAQAADAGIRVFSLGIIGALATGLGLTASVAFNTDSPYVGGFLAVASVAVAIGGWLGIGRDTFFPPAETSPDATVPRSA